MQVTSGYVSNGNAKLYYETAGQGQPFLMIHAGVADSRQWNNEFAFFANQYRVVRFDLRGYGYSEPVAGDYTHMGDLNALLDHLAIGDAMIVMGCSMGGGLAMDFTLAQPERVRALIMVASAPTGLDLDVPTPQIFEEIEKAFEAGDYDRAAELETHAWFDGVDRNPRQTNQKMRSLVGQMNRKAIANEVKKLGNRLKDSETPSAQRLDEIHAPVLVIAGEYDNPYILAAADYMVENLRSARKIVIKDAAHLPNMDHPEEFQRAVTSFLNDLPG